MKCGLMFAAGLVFISLGAFAAQPLSDKQLDKVTAGGFDFSFPAGTFVSSVLSTIAASCGACSVSVGSSSSSSSSP
jgi:hypothetical protein